MSITVASDDVVSGLDPLRYCALQDVLDELDRVAVDTAGDPLLAWMESNKRDSIIQDYILTSRKWVERIAKRDFDYHQDVAIAVDGTERDFLNLERYGFWPLVAVSGLSVSGTAYVAADYVDYSKGLLRFPPTSLLLFTRGAQNCTMTITWGYTTPPVDIVEAQAQRVAARVLASVQRSDTSDAGGPGGVRQIRYDDLVVTMGNEGRYATDIKRLEQEARETCMSYRRPLAVVSG